MARRIDYERSDISVRAAVMAFVLLSAAIVAIGAAIWSLERHLREPQPPAEAPSVAEGTVPAPRLQRSPQADLAELRVRTSRILESAAWVDRERGIVRVPIERAMQSLAERGWPSEEQP